MRLFAIVLSALLLVSGAAAGQEKARSWTGCYAGAHVGYSASVTDASIDVTGVGSIGELSGFGSSGVAAGGTAGCDFQVPGSPFVIGVWGDYTWHDQAWEVSSPLLAGTIAKLEFDQQWAAGGRLGYLVADKVMAYGLVGYTRIETNDIQIPLLATSLPVGDLDGWMLGGGVTMRLTDSIEWDVRYTYTMLDAKDVALFGPVSLGLETEIHTVRTGVNYRFNFGN